MTALQERRRELTTRSVPEQESLEFWHDAVMATLVGMDISMKILAEDSARYDTAAAGRLARRSDWLQQLNAPSVVGEVS